MRMITKVEQEYQNLCSLRKIYKTLMEDETSENLRIVFVRIDASYTLRDFINMDNSKDPAECYKAYLRLVDVWFSFEALLLLAAEEKFIDQRRSNVYSVENGQ